MNAEQFQKLLIKLNACSDAREWAKGKTWQEVFETCHRGDRLLWLFNKINPHKIKELALAKGHCANLARHWMKDQRSINALDLVIRFGEGNATIEELKIAADAAAAAYAAADAADSDSAYAAYDAAANAAADSAAYASASYAAAAAYAAADSANAGEARRISLQKSADICRQYLPIEIWGL